MPRMKRWLLIALTAVLFLAGGCGDRGGSGPAAGGGNDGGAPGSDGGGTTTAAEPVSADAIAKLIEDASGDMVGLFESDPHALAAYIGSDEDKLATLNEQLKTAHVERSNSGKEKTGTTEATVEAGGNEDEKFVLGDLVPMSDDEYPELDTLLKENEWVDRPMIDVLEVARDAQASKTFPPAAETLNLKNDTRENNEKIKQLLSRYAAEDDPNIDYESTWSRHVAADVKSTNPLMINSTAEFDVSALIGFGLFGFDQKFVPYGPKEVIVSWQTSKDGMYDKVVMRDDLYWSDGKKITAQDVEFSYRVIMSSKVPVPAVRSGTDQMLGVKAYGDDTVVYFHRSPLATNVWNINFSVIPKHIYEDSIPDDPTMAASPHHVKYDENPVTGGLYKIKKRVRGREIVLERSDSFYMVDGKQVRRKPYFKNIRFTVIEDPNTALLSMKKGDIEEMTLTPVQWADATSTEEFYGKNTKAYEAEWTYFYFGWNLRSPFFRDVRVRRAMGYAYNHAELIERHRKGLDEQATCIFHPTSPFAPDKVPEPLSQDLDKAEDLLAEAGWEDTDGDGILDGIVFLDAEFDGQLDGVARKKFEFTLVTSNRPDRIQMCELMRENLDAIGIVCDVRPVEFTTLQQMSQEHKFHAQFAGWGAPVDPDLSENLWTTKAIDAGRNHIGYSNPEIDKLFQEGKYEFDPEKRKKIYQKIALILHEDQPYTWLFFRNAYYAFGKDLRGVNFSARGPYHYGPGETGMFKSPALAQ